METNETNNDCMVLDKPQKQGTYEENAAGFRDEVAELTRNVLGEEKSMAFAAGVIAGIELIRNGTDPWQSSQLTCL